MLRVVFNIEAGNYYSKSTFIMTNKTRETCVHVGHFIHSGVFRCFYKLFTGTWVSEDFQFRVSGSRNNRKRTASVTM